MPDLIYYTSVLLIWQSCRIFFHNTSAHSEIMSSRFLFSCLASDVYWDSLSISEIKALHDGHPSQAYVGANGLYGSQRNVPDKQSRTRGRSSPGLSRPLHLPVSGFLQHRQPERGAPPPHVGPGIRPCQ